MAGYSFAFSYSRWSTWKDCPKQYRLKNIDKIDTGPPSKALVEGRKVHDDIGKWLNGADEPMPDRLEKHFSVLGQQIRDLPKSVKKVEVQQAYDRDRRPVSWFGKNAYTRFIWDAAVIVDAGKKISAVDWKTGRPYGSYDDQMQIFSIPAFWTYPNCEVFTGHLLYLDTGDDKEFEFTREQFDSYIERTWLANISMMEADKSFPATPSRDACKFCDFGKHKLGICEDAV